ncbi:MarR family transcriptional regulator [Bacillus haikouensis]|jgi:DNA-binding MarR family transcriptional regulator|uniref:MarR family winged helix-turn-helix transcriptional regulator n=1 Tax=Bacillus haikouensis TaxID=1510468 RepID=UPI001557E469|nr:MarR family transcriptional regulator [Bacillus haikouensis]NQD65144.1 MarR family transcriptional regulator [Bacillus haikouensis]
MVEKKYLLDDSIGYKLFQASRLMNSRLNQNFRLHEYTITYEQWQVLSRLYEEDGLTQNQLAMTIERDQGSISRLIDNMIKRGLVGRIPDDTDRRIKRVFLTEESHRIQEELEEIAVKTISQATRNMSEKELETCLNMLDQIRGNLK